MAKSIFFLDKQNTNVVSEDMRKQGTIRLQVKKSVFRRSVKK